MFNIVDALFYGFFATVTLTTLLAGFQAFGVTRMSLPFLIGTAFTPNRDFARVLGVALNFIFGWGFSVVYSALFEQLGLAAWWLGMALGLLHAMFILLVIIPLLPSLHPRMANEQRGPTPTRQLEPPGFLGMHYGQRTPLSIVLAHMVYGTILGTFYHPMLLG